MKTLILSCITVISLLLVNISSSNETTLQDANKLKESIKRGAEIYADFCVTCHLPTGKGVAGTFPPLAGSDYLKNNREASIKGIKYGQRGEITVNGETYNGFMARLGLEDDEVADVMNYITNSWGNENNKMITKEEVAGIKK
ncbi:cytochrome c [Flavobacteriaceae bacterium AU392]|nr:cytochrome c [Flavobacteriaceae bacterium]RKM83652.1 cytochrome c [Flavobacteriaceae bacterium AU392]